SRRSHCSCSLVTSRPLLMSRASFYCCLVFSLTPPTPPHTLSLHDALPIYRSRDRSHREPSVERAPAGAEFRPGPEFGARWRSLQDRKSTRLNSSHLGISYAVFRLKKKKKQTPNVRQNPRSRQRSSRRVGTA